MLGRSAEQPDFSAQWVLGPSPASLPPSPSLGTLNQTIKGLCAGNIVGSVRHLLAKSSPTEERTMYRDISLLVCALQGPQFDPGAEGRELLTSRCNTIAVHIAKQHHNILSLSTAIFFCLSFSEYFDNVFKAEVGKTPREYLSKLLPRDTDLPTQRSVHCRQAFWNQAHVSDTIGP